MLTRIFYFILDLVFPLRFAESDLAVLPRAKTIPHPHMYAVFSYEDEKVKEIIKYLKRIRDTGLFDACAKYLYDEIQGMLGDKKWKVIPIPITRARKLSRGYNQTEALASALVRLDNRFTIDTTVLYKIKETRKQAKIEHRAERLQNQIGSMRVAEEKISAGDCIIVIDDVITTGATCLEAVRALRESGKPLQILSIAIAH